jgi:hypothetical protein
VSAALVIQQAMCMRRVMLSAVAYLVVPYYSTSINSTIFERERKKEEVLEHTVCLDFLYKSYLEHFLLLKELNVILS